MSRIQYKDYPAVILGGVNSEYRYLLTRGVGDDIVENSRTVCWIMLNPSTADDVNDDATIRRCRAYTKEWGYDAIATLNLFALRSTDPQHLQKHHSPVGPDNEFWFSEIIPRSELIICGWGNHGDIHDQWQVGREWIEKYGGNPQALRMTKSGQPSHPLYLPKTLTPQPY